jgi:starch phosphorylase
MKRMIDDYIERFYNKEGKRTAELKAKDYAKAREIVAWKERVAAAWDGIKVLNVESAAPQTNRTGQEYQVTVTVDTNGLNKDLGLENVIYKYENGEEKLWNTVQFEVLKEEGNIVTFGLKSSLTDAGEFRYAYRLYPMNEALPHRQDFAYVRWI